MPPHPPHRPPNLTHPADPARDTVITADVLTHMARRGTLPMLPDVEPGERLTAPPRETDASRAAYLRSRLQVPRQYAGATLDTFETRGAAVLERKLELARAFVERWPLRLTTPRFPMLSVWTGQTGTGKTFLAYAIAKALGEQHGVLTEITTCATVIRELRASWRKGASDEAEQAVLRRYFRLDLLVVDEISSHALYGEPWQHLYDLVAPREADLRPTILITNEPPGAFEALLGPAVTSRGARWGGPWDFGTFDARRGQVVPRTTTTPR